MSARRCRSVQVRGADVRLDAGELNAQSDFERLRLADAYTIVEM
jgi:hypothetical protein